MARHLKDKLRDCDTVMMSCLCKAPIEKIKTWLDQSLKQPIQDPKKPVKKFFWQYIAVLLLLDLFVFVPFLIFLNVQFNIEVINLNADDNYLYNPIVVIILPAVEELIFRLPIKRKKLYFILSILFGILLCLDGEVITAMVMAVFFGFLLYFYLFPHFYKQIILISSGCFAVMHLTNYVLDAWYLYLFAPLLVGSQFLFGVFAGLIRRHGIKYSFFLHAAANFILLCIGAF